MPIALRIKNGGLIKNFPVHLVGSNKMDMQGRI